MKIFLYRSGNGNFGDDLNLTIWKRTIPEIEKLKKSAVLVGIGTILDTRLDDISAEDIVIFGTGVRSPKSLPSHIRNWKIFGVRGPSSAVALGLDEGFVIGDPAYLLKLIEPSAVRKVHRISYMSHMSCAHHGMWNSLLSEIGINYIRPDLDVNLILEQIKRSEILITEAMHGAIAADAFRIPFYPVSVYSTSCEGDANAFKWMDWSKSMGLELQPTPLRPIVAPKTLVHGIKNKVKILLIQNQLRKILSGNPHLSTEAALDRTLEIQTRKIDELRGYLHQN